MALEYITTRDLQDADGNAKGKIRIFKLQEESQVNIDLTCPSCGANEKRKENWSEPFTQGTGSKQTFNLTCNKCGFKIKLLKLKKEAAKKKK